MDAPEAFLAGIIDHQLHQLPAQAMTFQIRPQQDCIFRDLVIGVGVQPHHAGQLARRLVDSDEGRGAGIVDLGQTRDESMAEIPDRGKKAQPQIGIGNVLEERPVKAFILRADGPHEELPPIGKFDAPLHSFG